MRLVNALVLLLAGSGLFWHGYELSHSVRGAVQKLGAQVHGTLHNELDVTTATWFMIAGGVLIAGGTAALLKR